MGKIKQLSSYEAQKIAAGEVVERPANIVKELVENSIDAGATKISMYIEDAGKKLIRIVDNGSGMDITDAQLCFDRHATSKITQVNQLETIDTFGFRGEALASIASISKITLTTKENEALEGTQVTVEAHKIVSIESCACTTGTDIQVQDLFFNVPARKKFLKSTQTEWRAIQLLFNAFCFDYPHIHFSLYTENKQVLNCPSTDSTATRALQLWELSAHQHILPIWATEGHAYTVEGIISDHQHYRYDRSGIYLFVNKRWVKNQPLTSAVIKGYAHVIPEGRYPLAALSITVPADELDINIHPRKEEVKFLHPRRVEQMIQNSIKQALEKNVSAHIKKDITFNPAPSSSFSTQPHRSFNPFDFNAFFTAPTVHSTPVPQKNEMPITEFIDDNPFPVEQDFLQHNDTLPAHHTLTIEDPISTISPSPTGYKDYRLIGQYNKTYLLLEKENGLFLIDQHAAHERILYELFSHNFTNVITVPLLFPHLITLSQHDMSTIVPHLDIFSAHGIMIEQSAQDQLIVQSLPIHLKEHSITELIKETISWIIEYKAIDAQEMKKKVNNKLQAQMACKAAVKAGDELTVEKMHQLLTDLGKTANRFSCPHGRPTGWLISLHEIEKKFKRRT